MKQKMKVTSFVRNAVFAAACIGTALPAVAGTQTGNVTNLLVRASDGLVYFEITNGVASNKPACATKGYWMIRDENSEVGKKQYAMLLAAQASGRVLAVHGMNTCSRWSDGEDVNWLQLK